MTVPVLRSVTGHMVIAELSLPSSTTHSAFPLPLASTSAGPGYLVSDPSLHFRRVWATASPAQIGLLQFPLALTTGDGDTK